MARNNIKLEDIYPLTIIATRFGGYFIIFEKDCNCKYVAALQISEEITFDIDAWLEKYIPCNYGIGKSISEALTDYNKRI